MGAPTLTTGPRTKERKKKERKQTNSFWGENWNQLYLNLYLQIHFQGNAGSACGPGTGFSEFLKSFLPTTYAGLLHIRPKWTPQWAQAGWWGTILAKQTPGSCGVQPHTAQSCPRGFRAPLFRTCLPCKEKWGALEGKPPALPGLELSYQKPSRSSSCSLSGKSLVHIS